MAQYSKILGIILGISTIILSLLNNVIVAMELNFEEPLAKSIEKILFICCTVILCIVIFKLTCSIFFYKIFNGLTALEIFLQLLFQLILILIAILKPFKHYLINFVLVVVTSVLVFAFLIEISTFYEECQDIELSRRVLAQTKYLERISGKPTTTKDCVRIPLKVTGGNAGPSNQRNVASLQSEVRMVKNINNQQNRGQFRDKNLFKD